ncbi:hypothetical protein BC830DRAFT_1232948 [Chytriomyces sp. MP71]|nr:hypothetical protein BC830DRAFT_1232948 [Chytriomyces sp. MP71]
MLVLERTGGWASFSPHAHEAAASCLGDAERISRRDWERDRSDGTNRTTHDARLSLAAQHLNFDYHVIGVGVGSKLAGGGPLRKYFVSYWVATSPSASTTAPAGNVFLTFSAGIDWDHRISMATHDSLRRLLAEIDDEVLAAVNHISTHSA